MCSGLLWVLTPGLGCSFGKHAHTSAYAQAHTHTRAHADAHERAPFGAISESTSLGRIHVSSKNVVCVCAFVYVRAFMCAYIFICIHLPIHRQMYARARVRLRSSLAGFSPAFAAGVTWTSRTTSAPWAARDSPTTVIDAAGAIYVIGGHGSSTYYNDVWISTDGGARPASRRGTRGVLGVSPGGTPVVIMGTCAGSQGY